MYKSKKLHQLPPFYKSCNSDYSLQFSEGIMRFHKDVPFQISSSIFKCPSGWEMGLFQLCYYLFVSTILLRHLLQTRVGD